MSAVSGVKIWLVVLLFAFILSTNFAFADEPVPPPPGPIVSPITIVSNNSDSTLATAGDVVTLSFTVDVVSLITPSVTIAGRPATVVSGASNSWTAFTTMLSTDTEGVVEFSAEIGNVLGTATSTVTGITEGSDVTFFVDTIAPVIASHPDVTAEATGISGATVTYTNPDVTDSNSAASVSCTPISGSLFVLGNTTVNCTASDPTGNTAVPTLFVVHIVGLVPTASPIAGTYTSAQSVTLSASGSSNIRYTTDGSVPSCTSGNTFSAAISVDSSQTLQAISCYGSGDEFFSSGVASFEYTINIPAPTPSGGGGGGGSGESLYPVAPILGAEPLSPPPANPVVSASGSAPVLPSDEGVVLGAQTTRTVPKTSSPVTPPKVEPAAQAAAVGEVVGDAFNWWWLFLLFILLLVLVGGYWAWRKYREQKKQ